MQSLGFLIPVAAITVGPIAWVLNNWVRAKHGHEMERFDGEFEKRAKDEGRRVELLTADNERLAGQVSRLEERLRVLERIATDPATRTAREIDALRD